MSWFRRFNFVVIVASWLLRKETVCAQPIPKMLSKEPAPGEHLAGVSPEQRRKLSQGPGIKVEKIKAKTSIETGICGPEITFTFYLGPGSGRGVIGVSDKENEINLTVVSIASSETFIELGDSPPSDLFPFDFQEESMAYIAVPFDYKNIPKEGAVINVECSKLEERAVVIVRDDSDIELEASVLYGELDDTEKLELLTNNSRSAYLQSFGLVADQNSENVIFTEESAQDLIMKSKNPGSLVIAQVAAEDDQGCKHPRTILLKTRHKPSPPTELSLLESKIRVEDDDLELRFGSLGNSNKYFKYDVRATVEFKDGVSLDTIDVSAIVADGKIIIHNEWFHRAFKRAGRTGQTDGWEIYVDAIASDPDDGYDIVAHTTDKLLTGVADFPIEVRSKITEEPKTSHITQEMKTGRIPDSLRRARNRSLRSGQSMEENHKKILVYGYCSKKGAFPTDEFTDYIEFSDPSQPASWSHNQFAMKIRDFADTNNIDGCSCIGHSQGGAACLHLYTYFFSCLDNAKYGGNRLIQTVGTPFQGTALAGNIADLGESLGVLCGSNIDLTYNGAEKWLAVIPDWARSQVHYHTTSFEDKWWRYDFCNASSDLLLEDPDDGTIEKWSGQLPGGNNRGHKTGQCHVRTMRDPYQNYDSQRNKDMNENAKY